MDPIPLFSVGGRPFSVGDALELACSEGALRSLAEETAEGLACRQYASELGFELAAGQLQRAVEAWRYERKLTSARETMDWLTRFGLSVDSLSDYFEIRLWRARFDKERRAILAEYPPAAGETERRVREAAVIGDGLRGFARKLAWRAAALVESHGVMPAAALRDLLPEMENCYGQFLTGATTRDACRGELAAARFALLRVECEAAAFPDRHQACEAMACVREDGEDLAAVCRRTRVPLAAGIGFPEDLPAEIRDRCLSASPGEMFVVPHPRGDFQVVRLLRKIEPDLADDAVRARVEKRLAEAAFARLESRHVQWKDW